MDQQMCAMHEMDDVQIKVTRAYRETWLCIFIVCLNSSAELFVIKFLICKSHIQLQIVVLACKRSVCKIFCLFAYICTYMYICINILHMNLVTTKLLTHKL